MSRTKGTANLAASLEVLAGAPLDAREKVPTKADLYLAANFPYPYVGLETYVVAENKKYRLVGNDVTVEANWEEIGSGGGGGTTVVANPEGEATDDLEKLQVGNDIYSIPEENVEINKAQFDALPAATKNNGKAYFIPDANLVSNFTVMGNRFDKANIYDTTERMVGRWIDGKPLYQKTVSAGSYGPYASGWFNVVASLAISSSMDNIISCDAIISQTNNHQHIPLIARIYNGYLQAYNADSNWNGTYIDTITIQYTKTTDASVAIGTENDYSTDEMIIGTWIDGKPIYQKTVTIDSLPNAATTEYDVGLTDVSYVNISGYVLFPSGNKTAIPYVDVTNVNSSIEFQGNANGKVAVAVRADRRTCSAVLTLQYTKITD